MNTAIIFFTSCIIIGYALTEAQGNQYIYDKILDIEKIVIKDKTGEIIDTIKINHKFTLEIYGYLPDPCWEVYKTDLKELKNEFKINPMARRQKAKVCIQVIQPCTVSVNLSENTFNSSGKLRAESSITL